MDLLSLYLTTLYKSLVTTKKMMMTMKTMASSRGCCCRQYCRHAADHSGASHD